MNNKVDRLLVVDGSAQSSDLISYWLAREGFTEVYTATGGYNAITKAELIQPDIVIINVELPDISGFDLCKHLKKTNSHTLVLCISHVESETSHLRASESGADDYMETGDSYQFISKVRSLFRVKHLSNEIRQQYTEIEERNKLMESHMRMGRRVQRALIPDIDMQFNGVNLMSLYQPAMGVGGDFYNILRLDEDKFGIVMGDVSGHGIAASFLTVTLNVMVKNLDSWHLNPGQLLYHLNNEMCGLFGHGVNAPDLYACVFYAIIDTNKKQIAFANAGLTLPLLVEGGKVLELDVTGAPIGMIENIKYEQGAASYNNGDMLLFYTDGLQDCFYKNQPDEFLRHMKDILPALVSREMKEVLDSVCQYFYKIDASEHERMELDDVSMLLCRF